LPITFMTNGSERMRITSGGNVGIGDSGPSSKLQVNGDVRISGAGSAIDGYDGGFFDYASSTLRIRGQNSTGGAIAFMTSANGASNVSAERMRITSGGNVGIGTSSPAASLQVEKASDNNIIAAIGQSGYESALFLSAAGSNKDANIVVGNGRNLEFHTSSTATPVVSDTERMRLTAGGKLLINTTSDAGDYKLQVNGASYVTGGNFVMATGDIWIQSGGQGILSPNASRVITINNGAVEIGGTIKTAAPSGGTAANWKLGEAANSSIALNSQYVQIDINGTQYLIPTCYTL